MTSIKFKTTNKRIRYWVAAREEIFNNKKWYEFCQNQVTLKHKDTSNKNLIIKFYLYTGMVLVKGRDICNRNVQTMTASKLWVNYALRNTQRI